MRSVVIRAGDFFGGGTGTLLDRVLAKDLARGRLGLPGAIDVATPFAYLPDLAETFVRVAGARERLLPHTPLAQATRHALAELGRIPVPQGAASIMPIVTE